MYTCIYVLKSLFNFFSYSFEKLSSKTKCHLKLKFKTTCKMTLNATILMEYINARYYFIENLRLI